MKEVVFENGILTLRKRKISSMDALLIKASKEIDDYKNKNETGQSQSSSREAGRSFVFLMA